MGALSDAIRTIAPLYALPPLVVKAFAAVEGANAAHPDGVLQVTGPTRAEVIAQLPGAHKALALGVPAAPDLDARFAAAYAQGNLLAQVLCGAFYIRKQLDLFDGVLAVAGLAYNAGPGAAMRIVRKFGDAAVAAAHYHRRIGTGPNEARVGAGTPQVDPAIGAWLDFSVTANDTGVAIPHFIYLRQVPGRNFGLLDFLANPRLMAPLGLDDGEPALPDGAARVLLVRDGALVPLGDAVVPQPPQTDAARWSTQPLSQRDPRWAASRLGLSSAAADSTLGSYGCTVTCLTMLANGYAAPGAALTPVDVNARLAALGPGAGFGGATNNLVFFGALPRVCRWVTYKDRAWQADAGTLARVDASLARGFPVVVQIDAQIDLAGLQEHWVLLVAKQGDDYVMYDPLLLPARVETLLSVYGGSGRRGAAQIITHVVWFEGQPQIGGAVRVSVQRDPDVLALGGLAVRASPDAAAARVARVAADGVVALSNPARDATRIGVPRAWVEIDADGQRGWIAAWLVSPTIDGARAFGDDGQRSWKRQRGARLHAVIGARGAALRAKRGNGRLIVRLSAGARVVVLARDASGGARIQTSDGLRGFVAKGTFRVDKTIVAG
jgi:hypothetical protein